MPPALPPALRDRPPVHARVRTGSGMRCVAALLAAAVLALAGCGDGGSSSPVLSKRQYIERADDLQATAGAAFTTRTGRLPATPKQAAPRIAALDELIAGYEELEPPVAWRDEHEAIVRALTDMRASLVVVSRVSAKNRRAIGYQVRRYQDAQGRYDAAIRSINASR